ncbi:MAG: transposase [Bacteroidales bacterium]|nr:transposase [Bacteroidales bacterium]
MQGKKKYEEKLFTAIQLSRRIPSNNYYRKLKRSIDFSFIYKLTESLYGKKGKESLDPVVFFKLCFIRTHENISSDRKLIALCRIRLDLLFFLDYNLDDKLPAPSTVSHTRRYYPDTLFNEICETVEQKHLEINTK